MVTYYEGEGASGQDHGVHVGETDGRATGSGKKKSRSEMLITWS